MAVLAQPRALHLHLERPHRLPWHKRLQLALRARARRLARFPNRSLARTRVLPVPVTCQVTEAHPGADPQARVRVARPLRHRRPNPDLASTQALLSAQPEDTSMQLAETSIRRPVFATVLALLVLLIGAVSLDRKSTRLNSSHG